MRRLLLPALITATLLPATACASQPVSAPTPVAAEQAPALSADLSSTLDRHLAAVVGRDMDALIATITAGESLPLILPNGAATETREDYLAFHHTFFANPTWTMRFEPVSHIETGDLAVILLRARFETTLESGAPYWSEAWLTLTFRREPHGWALVHDQNTRIRTSADAEG